MLSDQDVCRLVSGAILKKAVVGEVATAAVEGAKLSLALLQGAATSVTKGMLITPAVIGAAAGGAASWLTSPPEAALKEDEQRIVNAKIKTMVDENRRIVDALKRRAASRRKINAAGQGQS